MHFYWSLIVLLTNREMHSNMLWMEMRFQVVCEKWQGRTEGLTPELATNANPLGQSPGIVQLHTNAIAADSHY